jgi:hypothetical protein
VPLSGLEKDTDKNNLKFSYLFNYFLRKVKKINTIDSFDGNSVFALIYTIKPLTK